MICTGRSKQAYAQTSENGKSKIEKQGMEMQTSDSFEYELDVHFEIINDNHLCKASKDRTRLFTDKPEFVITEQTGKDLLNWSNSGKIDDRFEEESKILSLIRNAVDVDTLKEVCTPHINLIATNETLKKQYESKKNELTTSK